MCPLVNRVSKLFSGTCDLPRHRSRFLPFRYLTWVTYCCSTTSSWCGWSAGPASRSGSSSPTSWAWPWRRFGRWCSKGLSQPHPPLTSIRMYLLLKKKKFFFFFGHGACRILVPQPGIRPMPPAVEAQSLSHWTTREVPRYSSLF